MIGWIYKDKLDPKLVATMEAYDAYLAEHFPGAVIKVHEDWAVDGHTANSEHYAGRAVDYSVQGASLVEAWLALERFPFNGIGIYPYWNSPGLHADVRAASYRARWTRDMDENYGAVGEDTLRALTGDRV